MRHIFIRLFMRFYPLSRVKIQRARFYVNSFNLFSIDNVRQLGIDAEITDDNGLQYPQHRLVNVGVNLSF